MQQKSSTLMLVLLGSAWPGINAEHAKLGDFIIVENGNARATVVTATEPTQSAAFAAWDLVYHVEKMTGVSIPVASENEQVKGRRILVGQSAITRAMGFSSSDFKDQEYMIRFEGDDLLLIGKDNPDSHATNIMTHGKVRWTKGKWGSSLTFDPPGGAVTLDDSGFDDEQGTLEAWIALPEKPGQGEATVLRLDGRGPCTYHIIRVPPKRNRVIYVTYDGKKGRSVVSKPLARGWHHVLATYSARDAVMELFIDGVSQGKARYSKTTCKDAD